jgi:hypothetical protein
MDRDRDKDMDRHRDRDTDTDKDMDTDKDIDTDRTQTRKGTWLCHRQANLKISFGVNFVIVFHVKLPYGDTSIPYAYCMVRPCTVQRLYVNHSTVTPLYGTRSHHTVGVRYGQFNCYEDAETGFMLLSRWCPFKFK